MRRCPFCDEEIRENAVKCKHRGSILPDAGRAALSPVPFSGALALHIFTA